MAHLIAMYRRFLWTPSPEAAALLVTFELYVAGRMAAVILSRDIAPAFRTGPVLTFA
jgi:hypothetical protein